MRHTPTIRFLTAAAIALALVACDDETEATGEVTPEPAAAEPPAGATAEAEGTSAANQAEQAAQEAPARAAVGETAPDFTLTDQAGTQHSLAQYRGKVVVLEWINPDCPYVQRHYQAQTMKRMVDEFPSDRVVWLAVDSSHTVQPDGSQEWREEHGLTYPILQDPQGNVGRTYEARTTPHMYVIDPQGVLRYAGAIDDDPRDRSDEDTNYVRDAVTAILAGNDPPVSSTQPYGCTVKYGES
jgi:peroxiredoxin